MPDLVSDSGQSSVVPLSPDSQTPVVCPLHHGLKPPISRLSLSWSRGNSLRVSVFRKPAEDGEVGGKVVEVKLGDGDGEIGDAQWRRIAYGSVSPFALLQSRKNSMLSMSRVSASSSPYGAEWWDYVMEYSREINFLLGGQKLPPSSVIEDPKTVLKDYDSLLSGTQPTVHSKLLNFEKELVGLQAIEEDAKYWEAISSALAVGWLDIAVKMLRLHGSYQLDQLGSRELENGLVEAVAVLISKMPRMRPGLAPGKLGECYKTKPDFIKAWETWRAQITKLDCSAFWVQCDHRQTREGLKNLLQIMLGNANILSSATCHWIELHISHLLYIRPFTMGLESMYSLAQKCMQLKPMSSPHKLMRLLLGILGENIEVVLAECSRSFGPWIVAHAVELLTAGSTQADILLHEERYNLGGISMEELHRLVYAQVLSSHALTWQAWDLEVSSLIRSQVRNLIAPIYLTSCMKQGMGLLEILLYKQPVQHNKILLKNIEICRLYELDNVRSKMTKIAGVHQWKHGKKGSGVFWLQQARDEVRLNRIAQQLFDFVGKSISDESFKQWEGLIELLGSETRTAGGLEFLHKYRDFKRSLQQVHDGIATAAAQKAAESLILLMKNPSTPHRFWLPLLYDSKDFSFSLVRIWIGELSPEHKIVTHWYSFAIKGRDLSTTANPTILDPSKKSDPMLDNDREVLSGFTSPRPVTFVRLRRSPSCCQGSVLSLLFPRPSTSSPLDNRAHSMANTSQTLDLEGLHCEMHGIAEKIRIMNVNNVRLIQHLTTNNPPPPPTTPVLDVERSRCPQRSGDDESQSHRSFSDTLKGSARSWFIKLSPGTIDSFGDLSWLFVVNFMSCKFNQAVLEVKEPSDEVVIMAMMVGLRLGPLFDSLSKNVPETMSTLQSKADKYIAAEELTEAK
ncbi:hypothetical protein Acr_00g0092700 [Actinidia rufa]|uniref:Nuclear pore complex protein Nup85 n=1 Tax=Actinidia rufa TaxID=165716 RepID=A0A7J0DXK3_9ERIC|nr:hypothetical protein Acr_00g0092700 [Actinidia rufa]